MRTDSIRTTCLKMVVDSVDTEGTHAPGITNHLTIADARDCR